MSKLRTTAQRKADVVAALEQNPRGWLATANRSGRPHIIALSSWWDGRRLVIATVGTSRTARNLDATQVGRLAVGSPDDVIMIDADVSDSVLVADADSELRAGFAAAVGWDPAEEGADWRFFRLQPSGVQAYRGYGELQGRQVMRNGQWLS